VPKFRVNDHFFGFEKVALFPFMNDHGLVFYISSHLTTFVSQRGIGFLCFNEAQLLAKTKTLRPNVRVVDQTKIMV
jgi:hypothetical protein